MLSILCLSALGVAAAAGLGPDPVVEREAWAMGTRVRVSVDAESFEDATRTSEAILREIERIEALLSSWDASSAVSVVNRAPVGHATAAPPELLDLLVEAEGWAARTGRAFEPAIGPLVDAWDLRGTGRNATPEERTAALDATGPAAFSFDAESGVARRLRESAWIDTGGFGKGAALRAIARMLEQPSPTRLDSRGRAVVEIGGQLWVSPDRIEPRRVEVAHPARRDVTAATLVLSGASVATSGHSERPGHILDPRTGQPTEAWGSVTVVSQDPLEADVLSTALYVMGPEEGRAWAETHGVAALFLVGHTDLEVSNTAAMSHWMLEPTDQSTN